MNIFDAGDEHIRCQRWAHSALEVNIFVTGDEWTCSALKTNAFGAGDKITRLRLVTKVCSAKDERTHLMLKANMFGARDELTRLVIETNVLGTRSKRVSQQTTCTHAFALYNVDIARQSPRWDCCSTGNPVATLPLRVRRRLDGVAHQTQVPPQTLTRATSTLYNRASLTPQLSA